MMAGPSALCTTNTRFFCLFGVFPLTVRGFFAILGVSFFFVFARAYPNLRIYLSALNSLPSRLALSFVLQEKFVAWGANSQLNLFNVTSPQPSSNDTECGGDGSGCGGDLRFVDGGFQFEATPSLMSASFSKREQAQLLEKAGDFIYTEEGSARVNVYVNLLSFVNYSSSP